MQEYLKIRVPEVQEYFCLQENVFRSRGPQCRLEGNQLSLFPMLLLLLLERKAAKMGSDHLTGSFCNLVSLFKVLIDIEFHNLLLNQFVLIKLKNISNFDEIEKTFKF